jgi:SNF2 family DNA or RNA helicase
MSETRSTKKIQRVYKQDSLALWLERLAGFFWEDLFSSEELELGRRLYRKGAAKALQVDNDEVTVQMQSRKISIPGVYAVISWMKDTIDVRLSSTEDEQGRALAIAGLYELEELIADTYGSEPLIYEVPPEPLPKKTKPKESLPLPKQLSPWLVCIHPETYGLSAVIQERTVIKAPSNLESRADRLRIMHQLRDHGWTFESTKKQYRLTDTHQIRIFLKELLPDWKGRFNLELTEGIEKMLRAPKRLTAVLGSGFELEMSDGESLLTLAQIKQLRLSKNENKRVFLAKRGWITWDDSVSEAFKQHAELSRHFQDGKWPAYMLFSRFMKRVHLAASLTQAREEWSTREQSVQADLPKWLRPYQAVGVHFLNRVLTMGGHPILADEMGLGKTVQTLALMYAYPDIENRPTLVVCPASVVSVWKDEITRFFPEMQVHILGVSCKLDPTLVNSGSKQRVILASYGQLRRSQENLQTITFGYAVLDEAQFIKNIDSLSAQTCSKIKAAKRIAITGTPIENHPMDLFSIVRFLMPGILGTRTEFERACRKDPVQAVRDLREQLRPFILRRLKNDVLPELPKKSEFVLPCPLTKVQRNAYAALVAEAKTTLGDHWGDPKERMHVLALLTRLRQVCCHPGLLFESMRTITHSSKFEVLIERLSELFENGHSIVIFSQFTELLELLHQALKSHFPDIPQWILTGATHNRSDVVKGFQENKKAAGAMLVSLRAGGTGITLHRADYVFILDPWWNPAVELQAMDRVHRIGQKRPVTIYRLISPGTLEERIEMLKTSKAELSADLLDLDPILSSGVFEHYASLSALIDLADTEVLEERKRT